MMIYLASQSPRRKEILKTMRIPFRVVASAYQEKMDRRIKPHELILTHAFGKVEHAEVPSRAKWVLGADTIVWAGNEVLGKPKNFSDAIRMLKKISGKKHTVMTGMVLLHLKTKQFWMGYEVTEVWVKKLSRLQMGNYIEAVHSYDKAGAYAIQMEPKIVSRIKGSYSNVVGLPQELLRKMLHQAKHSQ